MNEDETFRRLKRRPFDEVQRSVRSVFSMDEMIQIIQRAGWSINEYNEEFDKRSPSAHRKDDSTWTKKPAQESYVNLPP